MRGRSTSPRPPSDRADMSQPTNARLTYGLGDSFLTRPGVCTDSFLAVDSRTAKPMPRTPSINNDAPGSFHSNYGSERDGSISDVGKEDSYVPKAASRIFPIHLCGCCPPLLRSVFPATWQTIQDWTHFSLILGVCGSSILLAHVLVQLAGEHKCHAEHIFPCLEEALILFSTPTCGWYIMNLIGTYDEQIQEKERLIAERKKELSASYDSLIGSMDDLLGKAAESSATMAERSFESKRRDFQRFLERAETRYTQICGTKIDTQMMLQQFRRFVQRWLVVFEECSIDPINCPKTVVTEEELNRCRTIADVASLTLERLKATEVRFISSQRDKDAKMLRGFRAQIRRITTSAKQNTDSGPAAQGQEIELAAKPHRPNQLPLPQTESVDFRKTLSFNSNQGQPDIETSSDRAGSSFERRQAHRASRCCVCEWCILGAFPCDYESASSERGYPRVFSCVFFKLKMLSRMHLMLMIGYICTLCVIILEVAGKVKPVFPAVLCGAGMLLHCLVVLLVRFEQIDIIQRLEIEVNELAAESDRIVERKEQMVTFWNSMQQLTDLWVHRTVPRLDLLKEVQGHLEDAPPEDVLALMAGANTRLEDLENHLPDLSLWCHNDHLMPELTEESKKTFAERIERLCHEEKLPKILHGMNKMIEENILRINGPGPGEENQPMPPKLALQAEPINLNISSSSSFSNLMSPMMTGSAPQAFQPGVKQPGGSWSGAPASSLGSQQGAHPSQGSSFGSQQAAPGLSFENSRFAPVNHAGSFNATQLPSTFSGTPNGKPSSFNAKPASSFS